MNMQTTISAATEAVTALDFSAENLRIAQMQATIAELEDSRKRGQDRMTEIAHLLSPYHGPRGIEPGGLDDLDGTAVAEALLAGSTATEAANEKLDREGLTKEKSSLQAGCSELSRRIQAEQLAIGDLQRQVSQQISAALTPLTAALEAEARDAATVIIDCFASLRAVGWAVRANVTGQRATEQALEGLTGPDKLARWEKEFLVPKDIFKVLAGLESKGQAFNGALLRSVPRV
jgi:hypothetical protein